MHFERNLGAYSWTLAVLVLLSLTGGVFAQTSGQTTASASTNAQGSDTEGKEIGGFRVTQSIDVGGRISEVTGSQAMYDTLVNQQSGARLLDQSLTMQSLTHQDVFDTLTLNSFGWGGDPQQAARMRVAKYDWYNFSFSYQHMQNYFDYDLFANPLNPPTGTPFIPILKSPHTYYDSHNLYNYDLVLLPLHRFSVRANFNYSHINGPAFSSVHEGTEPLLNQNWNDKMKGLRVGFDYRVNKKTTLSYTQLWQFYSGITNYTLNPFNSWPLSSGTPVTFGLSWFNNNSPCSAPLLGAIANPSCNGFFGANYYQNVKTNIPTEQVNLKSSSLKWLDFTGQYQYSHAHSSTPIDNSFSGLVTRSSLLAYNTAGSGANSRWNTSSADLTGTIKISDRLRLMETFRFRNFSVAGSLQNSQAAFFAAASGGSATLLSPVALFPPTILQHGSSSPADITNEQVVNLVYQNMKQNDFQVLYDISRFFGVRVGFVWTKYVVQPGVTFQGSTGDIYYPNNPNRGNCVGLPLNADGSCTFTGVIAPFGGPTTDINRYSGVVGAWFRRGPWHANFDAQFGGADNWVYRIDPLRFYNIKGDISYAPRPWLTVGANLLFQHAKNDTSDIQYNQHNYSTDLNATINPNKYWGLDLAYNFNAIQQNIFLCYAGSVNPPDTTTCPEDDSLLQTYGFYHTHTQFGYFALTLTPIQRLTMHVGYNIVSNQGNTTNLNLLLPLGPLSSTYQSPLATVDFVVRKNVTFKAGWNYYQYGEDSFVGPTAPRYFHANNTTLALRYAF